MEEETSKLRSEGEEGKQKIKKGLRGAVTWLRTYLVPASTVYTVQETTDWAVSD